MNIDKVRSEGLERIKKEKRINSARGIIRWAAFIKRLEEQYKGPNGLHLYHNRDH